MGKDRNLILHCLMTGGEYFPEDKATRSYLLTRDLFKSPSVKYEPFVLDKNQIDELKDYIFDKDYMEKLEFLLQEKVSLIAFNNLSFLEWKLKLEGFHSKYFKTKNYEYYLVFGDISAIVKDIDPQLTPYKKTLSSGIDMYHLRKK